MAYAILKIEDPTLLKITTQDDKINELKYKTEKHGYENLLESLESVRDYYKTKHKSFKKSIDKCHRNFGTKCFNNKLWYISNIEP